jgi:Glycosyl hydrolase family 10
MGTMTFLLPAELPEQAVRNLERACVSGGPDNMPWLTEAQVDHGRLLLRRATDDSGYLVVPWEVEESGLLTCSSATLMERPLPYHFQLELARGKVNQLRCQAADWMAGGLTMPDELAQQIQDATLAFGQAILEQPSDRVAPLAQDALVLAHQAAQALVRAYVEQVFDIRHQRQGPLDTHLGCRLGVRIPQEEAALLKQSCNSVVLPLSWHTVEPGEDRYFWEPHDALLNWALAQELSVSAGPLIDFSSARLPDWLWMWERDLSHLASFMCSYVEVVIRRYRHRIRRWHITAASNCARVLALGEEELLWLTVRLAEVARQVDPGLEIVVGISQPWGDYMAAQDCLHSPFIFADTLIRTGLNLAALDLEVLMGVTPRGSACRDLLETSRLLDLYSLLGVPLRVTLGYPSAQTPDAHADPELRVAGGRWRDGFTPQTQADWAAHFAALAVAKPYVQAVHWANFTDVEPHQFPHCGLIGEAGNGGPALDALRELRAKHLR